MHSIDYNYLTKIVIKKLTNKEVYIEAYIDNKNIKLLFGECDVFPQDIHNPEKAFENKKLETEEEFQEYLTLLSNVDKVKGNQPIFCSVYGNCIYI